MTGTRTEREATSFTAVAREHLPWLRALAGRLVGRERAEDAVQECLLHAYRSFDRLRDHQAAGAWLRQILINCVRDRFRHQAARPPEEPVDPRHDYSLHPRSLVGEAWPDSGGVHLDFLHSFSTEDVWEVLDRIPVRYRRPLVLVHMHGHTTRQVARRFTVAQGTVLSWLHRGRKHFERELLRYASEHDLLVEDHRAASSLVTDQPGPR